MAKSKMLDPVSLGIIAATLVAIVFLVLKSGVVGGSQKIVILDADPLVEAIRADEGNADLLQMKKDIEIKAALLAEKGFIVLRSDMVRDAPPELYVDVY
jgi:hypothetical protein